jgi:hypothetical protein
MDAHTIAMILKPFAIFFILCGLLIIRKMVIRFFPEGKLKRLLLRDV